MVKTTDQPRDRKDSARKMSATVLKNISAVSSGLWPCKINGCNKQFAREADLKRHQRTTKLHSQPGFQCPQCEATFTRTDALRRHQKSRHHGVIIDPVEEEAVAGTSSPRLEATTILPTTLPLHAKPGPAGHASYYRQHTAITNAYIPQYAHVPLPTSATRLNTATNWTQSHPWPENITSQGYSSAIYYTPSPYYRQANSYPSPPKDISTTTSPDPARSRTQSPRHSSGSRSGTPQDDSNSSHSSPQTPDAVGEGASFMTEEQMKDLTIHLTPNAFEALLNHSVKFQTSEADSRGVSLHEINSQARYELEHMLTEDGENMLNPDELLSSESPLPS